MSQAVAASASKDVDAADIHDDGAGAVQGSPSVSAKLAEEPCMQGIEFSHNLKNPDNLQPVSLPLQLKLFARIPVVVSARLFGQTGKPSETFAQLLVK